MVKIGSLVEFIDQNVKFRGSVQNIQDGQAYIAVAGHSTMFSQPIARLITINESNIPGSRPKQMLHD